MTYAVLNYGIDEFVTLQNRLFKDREYRISNGKVVDNEGNIYVFVRTPSDADGYRFDDLIDGDDDSLRAKLYYEILVRYNKERIRHHLAKEILDEVSKHYGGAWLVELYEKYGVEVNDDNA